MILDQIVAHKRALHAERAAADLDELVARAKKMAPVRSLAASLAATQNRFGLGVIAEFKRRSPSAGEIAGRDVVVAEVARRYAAAGAAALSVLTDGPFFGARPDDLPSARAAVPLPVLRKDFLLDERDVVESRLEGADVVLLIARLLPDPLLAQLHLCALAIGLEVLVEVHSAVEAARAAAAGARIIGVNHRDLDTLAIDLDLSRQLAASLPADVLKVGESGLRTRDDLARMRDHGMDAVLIGEQLMRAPDPGAALAELLRC